MEKKKFWSGIEAVPIVGKMAEVFNLPQSAGLMVQKVVKFSPLGVLGLKSGEIEMIIDNKKILVGGDIIFKHFLQVTSSLLIVKSIFLALVLHKIVSFSL